MKDDVMTDVTLTPALNQAAAQAALDALNESLAYYTPETPVVLADQAETDYLPYAKAA